MRGPNNRRIGELEKIEKIPQYLGEPPSPDRRTFRHTEEPNDEIYWFISFQAFVSIETFSVGSGELRENSVFRLTECAIILVDSSSFASFMPRVTGAESSSSEPPV